MVETRPGYWDVDRCAWVGVEPMYVEPLADRAEDPAVGAAPPVAGLVPPPRPAASEGSPAEAER